MLVQAAANVWTLEYNIYRTAPLQCAKIAYFHPICCETNRIMLLTRHIHFKKKTIKFKNKTQFSSNLFETFKQGDSYTCDTA